MRSAVAKLFFSNYRIINDNFLLFLEKEKNFKPIYCYGPDDSVSKKDLKVEYSLIQKKYKNFANDDFGGSFIFASDKFQLSIDIPYLKYDSNPEHTYGVLTYKILSLQNNDDYSFVLSMIKYLNPFYALIDIGDIHSNLITSPKIKKFQPNKYLQIVSWFNYFGSEYKNNDFQSVFGDESLYEPCVNGLIVKLCKNIDDIESNNVLNLRESISKRLITIGKKHRIRFKHG